MKRKSIAVVGTRGLPASYGGVEKHSEELYTRLIEKGYKIIVYSRNYYTRKNAFKYFHNGIEVINIPILNIKGVETFVHSFISTIFSLFSKADIIHFHCQGPALFCIIPALLLKNKHIVFTCHNISWHSDKWGFFAKSVIKLGESISSYYPTRTIGVSQMLKNYYKQKFNVDVEYIPNGVRVLDPIPLDKMKEEFNICPNKYFLTVTRVVPEKNIEILIDAVNNLDNGFKLVIAGDSAGSDDYVDYLKKKAANSSKIIFTGYKYGRELQELYSNAFAYLSASKLEGLPITVLEAMSMYLPVIMSNIPAHLEINQQSQSSSFIFEMNDSNDCKEKINEVLNLSPEELSKAKEAARDFIINNYTWDKIVEKTHEVFQS